MAEQEASLRQSFKLFRDVGGTGKLTIKEFIDVLTMPPHGNENTAMLNDDDVKELVGEFDTNGDGELDIDEVRPAVSPLKLVRSQAAPCPPLPCVFIQFLATMKLVTLETETRVPPIVVRAQCLVREP